MLFHIHFCSADCPCSVFVIGTDCELPPEMVSLARLLLQQKADWEKTKSKGKVPKPTMDATIATIVMDVLQRRLKEYPTSIEVSLSALGFSARSHGGYRRTRSFLRTRLSLA